MTGKTGKLLEKILELVFLFICLCLVFYSRSFYDSYQLPKGFGILISLFFGFFFVLLCRPAFKLSLVLAFFILFVLYLHINTFISLNLPSVFYSLTLLTPFCFVFATSIRIDIKKFCFFILFLFLLSMLYGFIQVFFNTNKPFSFFGNPIFFAEFIGAFLPLIVYLYLSDKKLGVLCIFAFVGALAIILFTGSKGALISFFVSMAFLILKSKRIANFRLQENMAGIFFVFFLYLMLFVFVPGFNKLFLKNIGSLSFASFISSASVKNRMVMAYSAADMIKEKPVFGYGSGGVRYFYQKFQSKFLSNNPRLSFIKTSYVHNDYLQIAAEFGVFGLLLFLFFVFFLFYYFDKNSYLLSTDEYLFSISLISGMVFILCESFFNFPLFILPSSAVFFLFSGILHSTISKNGTTLKKDRLFSFVFLLLAFFLVSFSMIKNFRPIVSNFYCAKALAEGKNNSPMESYYYQKSIGINKKDYTASFNLGMHYFYKEDRKNAVKYFKRALSIYPYSADVIYNIASISKSLDEKKIAEEYFKKTLELHPNSVLANLNLGKLYIDMDKTEEGLKYIAVSKELAPDYYDAEQINKIIEFKETTYELK